MPFNWQLNLDFMGGERERPVTALLSGKLEQATL